jgi:extradiol dioxygenase family protein
MNPARPNEGPAESPRVHAVEHLHVEVPHGCEAAIRAFYGELLGLKQLPDTGDALLAFGRDRLAVRFVACERPRIVPSRRRLTVTVESLAAVQERLEESGTRFWTISGLSLSERSLLVLDPFDQIVEVRQSQRL